VIVEPPFVTAEDIAAEYRPGGGVTVKATLRRLRDKQFVSEGVAERPRASGGKVAGALHVYSALNLDAARAARSGELATVPRIVKAAERIESRRRTKDVVRGLAELGPSATLRRRFEWAASFDARVCEALRAVAAETVAERNRLVHGYPLSPPRLAFVMKLHGDIAELELEGAEAPVAMPIPDLDALDSAFVGAALALRFEPFGRGQTLIKAAPALRLDGGDEGRIYPYERSLPDAASPIALASAIAAPPTVRRPRQIAIAGRR
jgi:hypothetical protein